MSRLVYKGDTINNFGRHLPVPYIERIEISNTDLATSEAVINAHGPGAPASKITLYITLLFNTDDDFDVDAFKQEVFSELDLNVILLSKRETIEQLRDDKKNLKSLLKLVELVTPVTAGLWQHQLLDLNEFIDTITFTGDYDEDMNSVLRTTNIVVELETVRLDTIENLSVFVGTSVGDPADFAASSNIAYALNFSSFAYEHIFINSELATRDQTAFFTVGSDEFYSGVPLRAINKKYYKTEDFGPDDIKLLLNGVMNNYRNYVNTDDELASALQNIEFLYARYGEETSFLTELQKYASIFPNRDVTTPTGNLYESFKRSIINSNTLLIEQSEVAKKLVRTTKIRDLRPIQYTADYVVSYNEAYSSADILYEAALHTNLAKYVVAPDSPEEGELYLPFEAEIPITPQELTDEFREALQRIFAGLEGMSVPVETFDALKLRIESEVGGALASAAGSLSTYLVAAEQSGAGEGHEDRWTWGSYSENATIASMYEFIGFEAERSRTPTLQFGFDLATGSDPRELPMWTVMEGTLTGAPDGFWDGFAGRLDPLGYFYSLNDYHNLYGFHYRYWGTAVLGSSEFTGAGVDESGALPGGSDIGIDEYWVMEYDESGWGSVTGGWTADLTAETAVTSWGRDRVHDMLVWADESEYTNLLQSIYSRFFDSSDPASRFMMMFDSEYMYEGELGYWGWDLSTAFGRANATTDMLTYIDSYLMSRAPFGAWTNIVLRLRTGRIDDPISESPYMSGTPLTEFDNAAGAPNACGGDWTWVNYLIAGTAHMGDGASTAGGVCEGPGNWSYCLGTAAAAPMIEAWYDTWRSQVQVAIERAIDLLYAYWGNTVGTGRHSKLAEVDIVVQKYGWYFFDMEKYIRHQSHLSRFMDVSKLINHFSFSRDILNYTIRLAKSRCETALDPHASTERTIMRLRQDVSPISNMPSFDRMSFEAVGDYYHMKIPALDVGNWKDFVVDNSEEVGQAGAHTQSVDSTNVYAYLMLRNFDFPDNAPIDDNYRLMAFNYNYFMDDDEAISGDKETLSAMVTVEDNSMLVVFRFGDYLRSIYDEFLYYYDLAKENCAYNRYDSQFNTFFADSMNEEYAGNLINAPWFKAPVVLALYRDLFNNQFGGDMFYILENARKRSDNINPITGYLEALEQFKDDFEELITHYEGIEAEATRLTSVTYEAATTPTGGSTGTAGGGGTSPFEWGTSTGGSGGGYEMTEVAPELSTRQTYVFGTYSDDLPDDNPELGTVNRGTTGYMLNREIIDFVGNYEDALPEVPAWFEYSTGTAETIVLPEDDPGTGTGAGAPMDIPEGYTSADPGASATPEGDPGGGGGGGDSGAGSY
tara:strand:- start:9539 stop:13540 length:4002 start_codon:yes stop_codon:yes gene_type:complete